MARRKEKEPEMTTETTEVVEVTETAETTAPAAPVAEPKVDERYKLITDPDTGEEVKRKDYILKCWSEKRMSRGDIAKKLSEITGKKVPYQIVFAATKGVAGGPVKQETSEEVSTPTAE